MKKLSISIALTLAICLPATAQEAFKHLSIGVEAGTTILGVHLAMPVVDDFLVLKAGMTFPNFSVAYSDVVQLPGFISGVNEYVNKANLFLSEYLRETTQLIPVPASSSLEASAQLNMTMFKAILEFYPIKTSGFHVSAGLYIGGRNLANADAVAADLWEVYETDAIISKRMSEQYPEYKEQIGTIPDLTATIDGKTYKITSPGNVNIGVSLASVRPYLGIGFGRSVPDSRIEVQFDLGGICMLNSKISSTNEVPSVQEVDSKTNVTVYPVLNLGLVLRIF